ncbi:Probable nitric oxide-dependent regulator [Tenacibaculum maritimum]|uniref:iron-sulfur cluster repair di-iron protein n=1 Tax=Tenacibaculum maritimum TaxID=107401 RepID=UPI0012E5A74B|nr:iron-sulfur cluster repair di-iron protein [Tenacibaculum maritimum]CAA0223312.1 Probable nitric oxide-dependent regulator [Tenacibaculum maritimum]
MDINNNTIIADIVTYNYKTAAILKKYKIDFCCHGNRTLAEASEEKRVDLRALIEEVSGVEDSVAFSINYQDWDLDFMSDYIYDNHHAYIEKQIPEILHYLNKICRVHRVKHPELLEIRSLFKQSADELTKHMKKEELILFPFIKKIAIAERTGGQLKKVPFGSIKTLIDMMHTDHDKEGNRFRKIAEFSNNYTPPNDSCNFYKIAFSLLKDFEEDLHKHIHLENNILFKRAIATEIKLNKQ